MQEYKAYHRGRVKQIPIYLGKFFRMFVFLNDWKVLPMSALIAAIVAFVACADMFKTMEGTLMGAMALTCVCLWNGCFNSIQVVCREREIVKREHRAGMHISSYIAAHMIYQAFLCLMQTVITLTVCRFVIDFPAEGIFLPHSLVEFGITLFLITYSADMLSLMISCIVKNTTAAMTAMPLVLIVQLVFSGIMFTLSDELDRYSYLTVARWGMNCICALSCYNSQPMVSVWNQLVKVSGYEVNGTKPLLEILRYIETNNKVDEFCAEMGTQSTVAAYDAANIGKCWLALIGFAALFAVLAVLFLKRVDKDKR